MNMNAYTDVIGFCLMHLFVECWKHMNMIYYYSADIRQTEQYERTTAFNCHHRHIIQ